MTTTQAPEKTPNAFQRGVNAVIDLLSSFFLPIINLLVSVGILKGILTLLQVSGMVTDDSTTYAILNAMADSLFYFIPVFLAYTSSKRFDVDTVTAVLLGCILVYPSITTIMAADAPVYLFGHHLNFDGEMFTYLRDAWRQEKFDALGDMRWSTPAEGTVSLHPAFSMSVDKSFADIQMFDFNGTAELRAWLSALSAQATAKADGCDALCAGAKRVVTLVTCSANFAGGRARTLTVFVG